MAHDDPPRPFPPTRLVVRLPPSEWKNDVRVREIDDPETVRDYETLLAEMRRQWPDAAIVSNVTLVRAR